ncbi:hypothetical protein GWN42_03865 [candidate division KSB1 bacterium]|nr:hypothetical protein [candidate division KSB1 bacterium]
MYVICFYWQGDRWQQSDYQAPEDHKNLQETHLKRAGLISDDLPSRYINNLYQGVKRFSDRSFRFVCFTNESLDVDSGVELRSFSMPTLNGVLPRIYMFSREAGLKGQVLCLDIDVVVVGSLMDIMNYSGRFCARSKFKKGLESRLDGDVMSFRACLETENLFWKPFIQDVDAAVALTKGRERYWVRHVAGDFADRWDKYAPNQVLSYKRHVRGKRRPPSTASIVSCHGIPRPHEIEDAWIKEYWR